MRRHDQRRSCVQAPPFRDSNFCLAHDPECRAEQAEASQAGGVARHDPETLTLKAEVCELMTAMRDGDESAGVGSVLLQAIRLLRELEADDRLNAATDDFVESMRSMRESSDVPDLSEPANDGGGGMSAPVDDLSEPADPEAPRMEDYRRPDGMLDGEAYLQDSAAHKAVPLSHLTVAQRRERFAGNR